MSPYTGLGIHVWTSSSRFWSLKVPLTRYFPIAVNETRVALPFAVIAPGGVGNVIEIAVALFAACAAFKKPCGVNKMSSCLYSATGMPARYWPGCGTGVWSFIFQA